MNFRFIETVRSLWGAVLLAAPRLVASRLPGVDVDRKAIIVTRVLGARHLMQATLSGINPSRDVLALGAWVDAVHSVTAFGLAVADRHRARGGIIDGFVAAAWALFGWRDIATVSSAPVEHQRRRDRLARAVLALLPGGKPLLARAQAAATSDSDLNQREDHRRRVDNRP